MDLNTYHALQEEKYDLLARNGLNGTDLAYKELPAQDQLRYLELQDEIDKYHSIMSAHFSNLNKYLKNEINP